TVEAMPDSVEVDLQTTQSDKSVEPAKAAVDRTIAEVLSLCRELGVEPNMVVATDLAISPRTSNSDRGGNGVMQSWHNRAAMLIDVLPDKRLYRCNDGHPDDNFDDVVFRIEFPGS